MGYPLLVVVELCAELDVDCCRGHTMIDDPALPLLGGVTFIVAGGLMIGPQQTMAAPPDAVPPDAVPL